MDERVGKEAKSGCDERQRARLLRLRRAIPRRRRWPAAPPPTAAARGRGSSSDAPMAMRGRPSPPPRRCADRLDDGLGGRRRLGLGLDE